MPERSAARGRALEMMKAGVRTLQRTPCHGEANPVQDVIAVRLDDELHATFRGERKELHELDLPTWMQMHLGVLDDEQISRLGAERKDRRKNNFRIPGVGLTFQPRRRFNRRGARIAEFTASCVFLPILAKHFTLCHIYAKRGVTLTPCDPNSTPPMPSPLSCGRT